MNDTEAPRTDSLADVRAYVARVRAALSDLAADDVDELTQGMEADLVELAAESGRIRSRLGAPERYAAELRAAAGLPPRSTPTAGRGSRDRLAGLVQARERLQAMPWMRDLYPVGWVLRGVAAAWVFTRLTGADVDSFFTWVAGAAVSFWAGRRTLNWTGGRRRLLTAVNVVASLVVVFNVLPGRLAGAPVETQVVEVPTAIEGLANNGEQVTSITVYDATGRKVEQPRAFDQGGNPLLPLPAGTYSPPVSLPPLPQSTPGTAGTSMTPAEPATPAPTTGTRQATEAPRAPATAPR